MSSFFDYMQSEELRDIMNYLEYLEANDLELDENGREVPKNKDKSLTLEKDKWYPYE